MTDNVDNRVSPTPESSRRYIQWKEEDVGLLLTDLEQPGHYEKWKENKSGYSKRVGEQLFKNSMNHEAIKFKVRWLESRFKRWHEQLTLPEVEEDKTIKNNIREKMFKEFPYYDRCQPIFDSNNSHIHSNHNNNQSKKDIQFQYINHIPSEQVENISTQEDLTSSTPSESIHIINEPDSPNSNTPSPSSSFHQEQISHKKRIHPIESALTNKKRKQIEIQSNHLIDDHKIKLMEIELEYKKMDHQERMQEMKLEQLKLEIQLQTLKRDTPSTFHFNNNCN